MALDPRQDSAGGFAELLVLPTLYAFQEEDGLRTELYQSLLGGGSDGGSSLLSILIKFAAQ